MESTNQSTDQSTDQSADVRLPSDFVRDLVSQWPKERRIAFLRDMQGRYDSDTAASAVLDLVNQQFNHGSSSATGAEVREPTSGLSNVSQMASLAAESSTQGGNTLVVPQTSFSNAANAALSSIDWLDP